MTNINRLKSEYDRLVRDLKREEDKAKRLEQELNRAEAKERDAVDAVKRAKPEHRGKAEDKRRAAKAEADKIHARYMAVVRGDVRRAKDKVIAAYLRIKDAEKSSNVAINVAHPGSVVGVQGRNLSNVSVTINGRTVHRD